MSTSEQIAALQAQLRKRYWEIEAARAPHVSAVTALQAERDAKIDTISRAEARAYAARIKAARAPLADLERERHEILGALRDGDGKIRLGSA